MWQNSIIVILKAKGNICVYTFLNRSQRGDVEMCKYGIALFPHKD